MFLRDMRSLINYRGVISSAASDGSKRQVLVGRESNHRDQFHVYDAVCHGAGDCSFCACAALDFASLAFRTAKRRNVQPSVRRQGRVSCCFCQFI